MTVGPRAGSVTLIKLGTRFNIRADNGSSNDWDLVVSLNTSDTIKILNCEATLLVD